MSDVGGSELLPVDASLESVARCVCVIKGRAGPIGTGFLIGPDRVMTAAHVVALLVALRAVDELVCAFEIGGASHRIGEVEAFVPKPGDPFDPPTPETLDFAVLRLRDVARREWLHLDSSVPAAGEVVTIVQHPNGGPMRASSGTVTSLVTEETRVRYRATTRRISSGSPVLDAQRRVIAMHTDEGTGENEGVLMRAIRSSATFRAT